MNKSEPKKFQSAYYCARCRELVIGTGNCSKCGVKSANGDGDGITFAIGLDILICDDCGHPMDLGVTACASCGSTTLDSEYSDPSRGPHYRQRVRSLGKLASEILTMTANVVEFDEERTAPVSDEQFVDFLSRHSVFSAGLFIESIKASVAEFDLGYRQTNAHDLNKQIMRQLISQVAEVVSLRRYLLESRPSGQLFAMHGLTLSALESVLNLYNLVAKATQADTTISLSDVQHSMQATMDRLTALAQLIAEELSSAKLPSESADLLQNRLSRFLPPKHYFNDIGTLDLSEAMVGAIQRFGSIEEVADFGRSEFAHELDGSDTEIEVWTGVGLFFMASQLAASVAPMTIRTWTRQFLQVYEAAWAVSPQKMQLASKLQIEDSQTAIEFQQAILELLASAFRDELSDYSRRIELGSIYQNLSEYCYRRTVNILLWCKLLIEGKDRTYEDIQFQQLGVKMGLLQQPQTSDTIPSYMFVERTIRNAVGHGDSIPVPEGIRVVHRDKHNPTLVLSEIVYTDDEFMNKIQNLLITCSALQNAFELFQIRHQLAFEDQMDQTLGTYALELGIPVLFGLYGLRRGSVTGIRGAHGTMKAEVDTESEPYYQGEERSMTMLLVRLFPKLEGLRVTVGRNGGEHSFDTPIAPIREYWRAPSHLSDIHFVRAYHLVSVASGIDCREGRYNYFISSILGCLIPTIQEILTSANHLPLSATKHIRLMREAIVLCRETSRLIDSTPVSLGDRDTRDQALAAMSNFAYGLSFRITFGPKVGWHRATDPDNVFGESAAEITRLLLLTRDF